MQSQIRRAGWLRACMEPYKGEHLLVSGLCKMFCPSAVHLLSKCRINYNCCILPRQEPRVKWLLWNWAGQDHNGELRTGGNWKKSPIRITTGRPLEPLSRDRAALQWLSITLSILRSTILTSSAIIMVPRAHSFRTRAPIAVRHDRLMEIPTKWHVVRVSSDIVSSGAR